MRFFRLSVLAVLLAGCGMFSATPFPTTLPSQEEIDARYKTVRHNLSPRKDYHFDITLPLNWQILDSKLIDEPTEEISIDMAAFRAPGPWMDDEHVLAGAEVTVTALRPKTSVVGGAAAQAWLTDLLGRSVPGYRILDKQLVGGGTETYADVLVRYNANSGPVVARMRVQPIKQGSVVLVLTASAPEKDYADVAEALFVATQSFKLVIGK